MCLLQVNENKVKEELLKFFLIGAIPLCYPIETPNKYYYIQSEHNK